MSSVVRPRRRLVVPVVLLVVLVLVLVLTLALGSWWFRPQTPHSATGLGWVLLWAVTSVSIVITSSLLVVEALRRRARWLWLLIAPLVLVAVVAAWSARLESFGPTSDPEDQTWVWPFAADR